MDNVLVDTAIVAMDRYAGRITELAIFEYRTQRGRIHNFPYACSHKM